MGGEQSCSGYIKHFKDSDFKIFRDELEIIREARGKQNATQDDKTVPTTEHELVGLALSGGGIRSATFNLGFLQALCRHGILKNVHYLSTVSGGGYIGSSLTTLLNSDFEKQEKKENKIDLLDDENFPFSIQHEEKSKKESKTDGHCHKEDRFKLGKEKKPVEHLRYYSNYLTAAGNFIGKYLRPAMVVARGIALNFCLIIPYILMAGLLLSIFFKIPSTPNFIKKNINIDKCFFNLAAFEKDLKDRETARESLKRYVLKNTAHLPRTPYEDRLETLSAVDAHAKTVKNLQQAIKEKKSALVNAWRAVWLIPLVVFLLMLLINLLSIHRFTGSLEGRFKFSRFLSNILFISLALLLVNLFGVAVAYWGHWHLPPEIGFVSLLSLLAPKLLSEGQDTAEKQKKPWMRLATSIFLFALVPLFLLFLVGTVIKFFLPALDYVALIVITLVTWVISEKWININKISLHNFYRDRLSRAYLIQHNDNQQESLKPFAKIKHRDDLKMSKLKKKLPYHIINTNLNLTKKLPSVDENGNFGEGVLRDGESFIFSRNWCGSEKTGYRITEDYEKNDNHLDLGSAMAISGAAVNIGMAHSNLPVFRLLLGLLNIRLGYWAVHPGIEPSRKWQWLVKKSAGSLDVIKEWIGLYSQDGKFINLSDGGHFDNIGVYELLRRRCKYIIVGDAEADPEMRFQALSYIIRLARIDFGIEIEIDISDIQPGKDTGLSRNYCAIGIIKYPVRDGMAEEVGYLLYCKSSLTGDEPPHLHEYKTKHPQFPHQTTADQWFDEQQFEAYRELGYQVGKKAFKPVTHKAVDDHLEEKFIKLKEFWHPHSPAVERYFTKHGQGLNAIINQVKNDSDIEFMDAQMFPEWDDLLEGVVKKPDRNLWLPDSSKAIRKGFYACNQMIQLMENVYLDLNLEANYDHPDNRGWMNLFRHWSWAGIFRVTWAISACTFGSRFQSFCQQRLDLELGDISIEDLTKKIISEKKGVIQEFTTKHAQALAPFLNEYERVLARKIINDRKAVVTHLFSFHLIVKNPLDESQQKKFSFGFALMNDNKITYFRIQDHLRNMGLGRQALKRLIEHLKGKYGLQPEELDLDIVVLPGTEPGRFKRMFKSVIAKIRYGPAAVIGDKRRKMPLFN